MFVLNPKGPEFKRSETNQMYYNLLPIKLENYIHQILKSSQKIPIVMYKKVA